MFPEATVSEDVNSLNCHAQDAFTAFANTAMNPPSSAEL